MKERERDRLFVVGSDFFVVASRKMRRHWYTKQSSRTLHSNKKQYLQIYLKILSSIY